MRHALSALLALSLTGCTFSGTRSSGSPPPLLLGVNQHRIPLDAANADSALDTALSRLGDPSTVHATINGADPQITALVTHALVRAGVEPARIRVVHDVSDTLVLRAYVVAQPDCRQAIRPSWTGDTSDSLYPLGQCLQAAALAAEIANPGDLLEPAHLQPANGARFGRVVELWEAGMDRNSQNRTPATSTFPSAMSSGSTGGSTGGSSSTPTTGSDSPAVPSDATTQSDASQSPVADEAASTP
ncbi:hypothetical protein [Gluconobacter albidus]|uniref:Pilus assembly protein CpaD n=1 Tax=Gluconobacter albidus TaxID=318683 RepID=A0AAW3QX87_9PROT|nr:hypothetical protein [Gluconobacter albidus]KXV38086.1 hypothetical protein AD941_07735 [Gluconobacter albidus]GBQ84571.1 hypothetical protein AA3250_0568 [Gluconobacter albidus NBRC 3250]GLQ70237.1 hypothetical protein GCM10007866_26900 [Gluconobacter albidus]